jgi:hypothetical protein
VPAGWVTADEADGGSPALRGWLEARQLLYVLAVKATEPLPPASGPAMPAARLAGRIPPHCWLRLSAGHGGQGPPLVRQEPPAARRHWRAGRVGALAAAPQPDQRGLAYYVGAGPAGLPLIGLVRVAGARWRVGGACRPARGRAAWTSTRSPLALLVPLDHPGPAGVRLPGGGRGH